MLNSFKISNKNISNCLSTSFITVSLSVSMSSLLRLVINAKSLGTLTVFFDLAGERSPLPLKTMLIYTGYIHSK